MPTLICLLIAVMMAAPAMAHDQGTYEPSWTLDPWVVVPVLVLTTFYGIGAFRVARRSGRRRRRPTDILLFACGMLTLAGALLSPLHWLGEHLLTFHMIEHEIVIAISAPLIVLSRPIGVLLWCLPRTVRHAVAFIMRSSPVDLTWQWCAGGTNATVMHGLAIWAWHVPALFDAAVTSMALHRIQHFCFFVTAVLFWWAIIWRTDHGASAWHLFVTMIHTGILGALMALSPRVLYVAQTQSAMAWSVTPLEDQQMAGMIMWVPGGSVYAAAVIAMLTLWIRDSGARKPKNA
ncbi:cytochrome c oxidase assembly protein [Rhizobiaceae sp. 2RAB30]